MRAALPFAMAAAALAAGCSNDWLYPCPYRAVEREGPRLSRAGARSTLSLVLKQSTAGVRSCTLVPDGVRLKFAKGDAVCRFRDFREVPVHSGDPSWGYVALCDEAGRRHQIEWWGGGGRAAAIAVADALQDLKWYAAHPNAADDFADFRKRAAVWRALAAKPGLSEAAQRSRVLAENAIRGKKLDEAVRHYEAGLTRDPLWPEGWYNSALLCGELGYAPDAVECARRYLELCPDTVEADPLRKRTIIWEDEARQQGWAGNDQPQP
ncbi:MAG TPA: tetratricopeptide repeat protein [Planctomycetota bacterium]|nr:tetratricopeptide repeat protein [Planctomycetota bacterium]